MAKPSTTRVELTLSGEDVLRFRAGSDWRDALAYSLRQMIPPIIESIGDVDPDKSYEFSLRVHVTPPDLGEESWGIGTAESAS